MTSEKPQIRLDEWLEKEGRDIMKSQKLKSLKKAIHKGWMDLKQENEELRRDNKNLREKNAIEPKNNLNLPKNREKQRNTQNHNSKSNGDLL
jgi:hypothetical protein